jgi:hypothetical protein
VARNFGADDLDVLRLEDSAPGLAVPADECQRLLTNGISAIEFDGTIGGAPSHKKATWEDVFAMAARRGPPPLRRHGDRRRRL